MKRLAAVLITIAIFLSGIGYLSLQGQRSPAQKATKWVAILRAAEGGTNRLLVESSGWVVTQSGMDTCVAFTNESENVALVCGVIAVGKVEP